MPLNQSGLANDLFDVFKAMQDGKKDDNYFAKGVTDAVKKYAEAGDVRTNYTGAYGTASILPGTQGNGKPSVVANLMQSVLDAIMPNRMPGGDPALGQALANGSQAMLGGPNTLSQTVVGTAQPPSGGPIPVSGTSTGKLNPVMSPLQAQCMAIFNAMKNKSEGGDKYFADELAKAIHTLFTGSPANTIFNGTGIGVGSIT